MKRPGNACLLAVASLVFSSPILAMETDQYYAWGKPIEDSTDYLNAWVRLQIQYTLDSRKGRKALECEEVVDLIQKRMQHSIYQPIEMWVINSKLVDKIPSGLEESLEFREHYLLANAFPVYLGRWLQPSPTLQVNDIRFGSDKLAHFFSEGWWYYRWWKKHLDEYGPERTERKLIRWGIAIEWWLLGMYVTGVVSMADLEANIQGFHFYHNLCRGEDPMLMRQAGRWTFTDKFNFADYINPDWDESWNPSIFREHRWERIKPTLEQYCPMLQDPWVIQQRSIYSSRDTETATQKRVGELVAAGKLPDPMQFDITAVCN